MLEVINTMCDENALASYRDAMMQKDHVTQFETGLDTPSAVLAEFVETLVKSSGSIYRLEASD